MDFAEIERRIGYTFGDKNLLKLSLTLSSYDGEENNESLECLGDALLTFLVAEKYFRLGLSEGDITKKKQEYLSDAALKLVSEKLGLDDVLLKDKGDTHNKKAVPSAYEAVTAAIYLDGGLEAAKKFAFSTLTPLRASFNYISALQELLQSQGRPLPRYEKQQLGTPREPYMRVSVRLDGKTFTGEGENFSKAKKIAAKAAYEYAASSSDGN